MIITIDGPSASGKSTIAQLLAQHNKMYYINSGYLYRAYAYIKHQEPTLTTEQFLNGITYEYSTAPRVYWHNNEITHYLKMPEVDIWASQLSAIPGVREIITALQRHLADNFNVVIDGRDCGSVVFPQADIKFFLTARVEVRARRWQHMQEKLGHVLTLAQAIDTIAERDRNDTNRPISPLRIPDGAILIDSSELSIQEVCATMQQYIDLTLRNNK